MPGRKGYQSVGGWAGSPSAGGSALPSSLTVDKRTSADPLEYKASTEIEFIPDFASREVDDFEAYIAQGEEGGTGSGGTIYGTGAYRYGFNGKENDDEVKGEGNEQDYGMRIYDPRLGRFLSVDPIEAKYPELTSYQFASNIPITGIDLDGMEFALNNWIFDIWLEWKFGDPTSAKTLMNGAVQKAYVETKQMSYHNDEVSRPIQNKLDQFNLNQAKVKIASGTAGITTFTIETSADASSSLIPLGEIKVSARFLSKVTEMFGGNSDEAIMFIKNGTLDFKELETATVTSKNSLSPAYHGMEFLDDGERMIEQPLLDNRLHHIFDKKEHDLIPLVKKYGSHGRAFDAVQKSANEALANGKLSPNKHGILPGGNEGNIIDVDGIKVRLIGGKVENNKVLISSFSRKDL